MKQVHFTNRVLTETAFSFTVNSTDQAVDKEAVMCASELKKNGVLMRPSSVLHIEVDCDDLSTFQLNPNLIRNNVVLHGSYDNMVVLQNLNTCHSVRISPEFIAGTVE